MAVSAAHIYTCSKLLTHTSVVMDLSSAIDWRTLLYDPHRDLIIYSVNFVYVTETAAGSSAAIVGTVSSGAVQSNVCTATLAAASQTVGTVQSGTLLTTLADIRNENKPRLTAGTVLAFKSAASSAAGEVQVVISYYPLQPNTNNKI